jgi:hypothetical protein
VSWFGVRLQLSSGQAFVARRCPESGKNSSEDFFIATATTVDLPNAADRHQTTNTTGALGFLNSWTGIRDNVHETPTLQRTSLTASVRHAVNLCFQGQSEINRKEQLFHGTDNDFAKRDLETRSRTSLVRSRTTTFASWASCARRRSVCVLSSGVYQSWRRCETTRARPARYSPPRCRAVDRRADDVGGDLAALRAVAKTPLASVDVTLPQNGEFARLSAERRALTRGCAQRLGRLARSRTRSAGSRAKRTSSAHDWLPLGSSKGASLGTRARSAPKNCRPRAPLHRWQRSRTRFRVCHVGWRLGRVGLYVESMPNLPDTTDLEKQAEALRAEVARLEEELSDERVQERLTSMSILLGKRMTVWAARLALEFSDSPLRFDFKKLTV